MLSDGGQFINADRLDFTKFAKKPSEAKVTKKEFLLMVVLVVLEPAVIYHMHVFPVFMFVLYCRL